MKAEVASHYFVDQEEDDPGLVVSAKTPAWDPQSYARQLRALGQAVEKFRLSAFDLQHNGGSYQLIGGGAAAASAQWFLARLIGKLLCRPFRPAEGQESAAPVVLRFTPEDIRRFDLRGQSRRRDSGCTPDPHSISQILRGAGSYLDQKDGANLTNISLNEKSVTITYQNTMGNPTQVREDLQSYYDFWVKMYLHRSNRPKPPPPSDPTFHVNWKGMRNA